MLTHHFPASHPAPSFLAIRDEFFAGFEFGFSLDACAFVPTGSTEVLGSTGGLLFTAHRVRAEIVRTDCPPVGEKEVAPVVTTPAASGPRAGIQSARMSSIGMVRGSGGAVRTARLFHVSTNPDSLMPSLMASLITRYVSQKVIAAVISSTANVSISARNMSRSIISIKSGCMVAFNPCCCGGTVRGIA